MISSHDVIFSQLQNILVDYSTLLTVTKNNENTFELISDKQVIIQGRHYPYIYFASVMKQKNYVTLHFFPIYTNPDRFSNLTPGLKKVLKGKSCFNFKKLDDELLEQIKALVKEGYDMYKNCGMINA